MNLISGNDTFVLMPTGGGKSLCYQLPALVMDGTAIVISPLIALMKNQVDAIRGFISDEAGIAHFLNSSLNKAQIAEVKQDLLDGITKLLYVAPESLTKEENVAFFKQLKISFYAVDEVHCISEWGHDFRPEYRRIRSIVEEVGRAPIIGLTATATPKVQYDIQKNLGMLDAKVFKSSFNRPNLYYEIREKVDAKRDMIKFIKQNAGKSGIVYCLSRKRVEEIAELLNVNGIKALPYHAGMDAATRSANQDKFLMEEVDVIVATIAFGMGIDKPDVRFVCHFDMPDSIEAYFQEAGRGGRDGKRSYAVLLWNDSDVRRLRQIKENSFPSLDYIEDIYHKVHNYFGIPFGYGEGHVGKFNINDFCSRYKLPRSKVASSVKYIEMENHWEVEAEGEIPTRVGFSVSREELYSFNPGNALEENVVDFLMRRYPGIFSQTVTIDTGYAARLVECSENEFKKCLYGLYKKGIIIYIPSDKTPLIRFKENRLMPKDVYLPKSRYDDRLRRFSERLESIISYVSRTDECRSVLLLGYFGEKAARKCGKCDVCLAKSAGKSSRRKEMAVEIAEFVSKYDFSGICRKYSIDTRGEWLISAVSTNEFLKDMVAALGDGYKDYISVLRRMLDSGALGNIRNP